jgi:hypothetical protein
LLSFGALRAPAFSFSVTRDGVGLEDEFELSMQLFGTYFSLLRCSCWHAPPDLTSIEPRRFRLSDEMRIRGSCHETYCTQCQAANTD